MHSVGRDGTPKLIMRINYKPTSDLEKFGVQVYSALVENFPQTFFVGGMVRDLLLKRKITDIDIATEAKPEQMVEELSLAKIAWVDANKKFGSIMAKQGSLQVEITTFRKDLKSQNRYPKVSFLKSPKPDSLRRDFTINSLYLNPKTKAILDFQNGLKDLKLRRIKFIGRPSVKITEDPLRILRALRFALVLNFNLEKNAKQAIKNKFYLVKRLTKTKIEKEINKIKTAHEKNILEKVINSPKLLDKYFK